MLQRKLRGSYLMTSNKDIEELYYKLIKDNVRDNNLVVYFKDCVVEVPHLFIPTELVREVYDVFLLVGVGVLVDAGKEGPHLWIRESKRGNIQGVNTLINKYLDTTAIGNLLDRDSWGLGEFALRTERLIKMYIKKRGIGVKEDG